MKTIVITSDAACTHLLHILCRHAYSRPITYTIGVGSGVWVHEFNDEHAKRLEAEIQFYQKTLYKLQALLQGPDDYYY